MLLSLVPRYYRELDVFTKHCLIKLGSTEMLSEKLKILINFWPDSDLQMRFKLIMSHFHIQKLFVYWQVMTKRIESPNQSI